MPEGPSIVILKEAVQQFRGQKVISVSGNSKIDMDRISNQTVVSFKSWGKHFLICFEDFTLKVHLLMFGTYRINERKDSTPRLSLVFANGELNLYTCSIKILEGDVNLHYDWSADVMNEDWNPKLAKEKLLKMPRQQICDALLDQDIFSGVGNIIKNEVLYRTFVHPESLAGKIPADLVNTIIDECSKYSFEFLEWKRNFVLRNHWLVYTKRKCSRCNLPIQHRKTGLKNRRSFYCENCQKLYL
ncbi:DNA-formamidopyrimidine glycosylase family protein [Flavobacterium aquicola]|uniref:Endonuclease-8 n=1 Tax=Flavobacterium aquicola TaxID=1682742 RepID=A0A3E0ETQ5_9FLAO|nr:DNA-formamidopyrimidine glycosylase family protein [Flavobacterium aquicola]REH00770.1 endonuclease-8 [Flavobacterium aquicola]